jgi:glycosyltransferase involved in cell wall biosynthesis
MSDNKKINLLHILNDFSILAGGVPQVVRQLTARNRFNAIASSIFATKGKSESAWITICPESKFMKAWGWSWRQKKELDNLISENNILHLHGIWSSVHYYASSIAKKKRIPFVLSSHGMLEPWLWRDQGLITYYKKFFYWNLFIKYKLSSAAVVHAITPLERENLKKLLPENDIVLIPNAVDIAPLSNTSLFKNKERVILFLGRIEPKKGLHLLLESFLMANLSEKWKIKIVGPVWDKSYMKKLSIFIKKNKLNKKVTFLGPVFGKEKERLLTTSWIMVTPSFSEVVGLVNLEAGAKGLPTITTHETGLFNWEKGGGLLVSPNVIALQAAIKKACSWSLEDRLNRGLASYNLIKNYYSWDVVAPQWELLYRKINSNMVNKT